MPRLVTALALFVLAGVSSVGAQESGDPLGPSTRVRVWPSDHSAPFLGTLSLYTADSIGFITVAGPMVLPRDSVVRLDISQGVHTNAWRGLKTGALVGAAVGLGVGLLSWSTEEKQNVVLEVGANSLWLGPAMGAAAGSLLGLGLGSLSKSERWQRVSMDGPAVRPVATWRHGRVMIGVQLSASRQKP